MFNVDEISTGLFESMRPDMNKVLCERERRLHESGFRHYRRIKPFHREDFENLPEREGMRRRYLHRSYHNRKEQNGSRNALKRWLCKNVGRPWDEVYSELCSGFDCRSDVNWQIVSSIPYLITTRTFIGGDGQIHFADCTGQHPIYETLDEFFVHPTTRRLSQVAQSDTALMIQVLP